MKGNARTLTRIFLYFEIVLMVANIVKLRRWHLEKQYIKTLMKIVKYFISIWKVLSCSWNVPSDQKIGNINVKWKKIKCEYRILKWKPIYVKPNIRAWKEQWRSAKSSGYQFSV